MTRLASFAIAVAFTIAASANAAQSIPLAQYIASLQHIQSLLDAKAVDAAKQEAHALDGVSVTAANGTFLADASLLAAIKSGDGAARLRATLAALRTTPDAASAPQDRKLLERLRAAETPRDLHAGGDVGGVPITTDARVETLAERIASAIRWIGDKIQQFYDWIRKWWPHERNAKDKAKPGGGTPWIVAAVVILIVVVLVILALEVARRSKRRSAAVVAESNPVSSARDDDPLSRGSNEWERYAAQLAAEGRRREAIRAWYHAVLVTLYGAAILHFRKGRTNWEYIAALSPDYAWRSDFIQLTRRFEQEWYGHDESTIEAHEECSERAEKLLAAVRRRAA